MSRFTPWLRMSAAFSTNVRIALRLSLFPGDKISMMATTFPRPWRMTTRSAASRCRFESGDDPGTRRSRGDGDPA